MRRIVNKINSDKVSFLKAPLGIAVALALGWSSALQAGELAEEVGEEMLGEPIHVYLPPETVDGEEMMTIQITSVEPEVVEGSEVVYETQETGEVVDDPIMTIAVEDGTQEEAVEKDDSTDGDDSEEEGASEEEIRTGEVDGIVTIDPVETPVVIMPLDGEELIFYTTAMPDTPVTTAVSIDGSSLLSTAHVLGSASHLAGMTQFGAHHRPLADNGLSGSNCVWATGDYGRNSRRDSRQHIEEVGGCTDIGDLRFGLGIGNSSSRQDLMLDGNGHFDGQYLFGEVDVPLAAPSIGSPLFSLSGLYGQWDVDMERVYRTAGGLDVSSGNTDASLWSLRTRLDWLDLLQFGRTSLSPFVALTYSRSSVDGYQEKGGSLPATFGSTDDSARELRAGASLKLPLTQAVDLRLSGEAVHRFDSRGAAVDTSITGAGMAVRVQGESVDQNWLRAGAELDWKLSPQVVLSTSLNGATEGEDADVAGSVSLKLSF